jgi:hypothetical protein
VPIVLKSGNLNLLEPSGPVKACNGIALPFTCEQWDNVTSSMDNSNVAEELVLGNGRKYG